MRSAAASLRLASSASVSAASDYRTVAIAAGERVASRRGPKRSAYLTLSEVVAVRDALALRHRRRVA